MSKALVITGGDLSGAWAERFIRENHYELIIAVDAGLKAAVNMGVIPDFAVGDFDTLDSGKLQAYSEKFQGKMKFQIHKPEKDETDTELALSTAAEQGADEIHVIGALGGRMDHELSNIQLLLYARDKGVKAVIYDERNKIYLAEKEMRFDGNAQYGVYISFVPLTYEVHGISLKGFKYPLDNYNARMGKSILISNEIPGNEAFLSFKEGILLCIESKD